MATLQPTIYQSPLIATQALATQALGVHLEIGQLTPPPSPGQSAEVATEAALQATSSIKKLHRAKTPKPLDLKSPGYEAYARHLKNLSEQDGASESPKRNQSTVSDGTGKVSPLSPTFDTNAQRSAGEISKPGSLILGPRSPLTPGLKSPTSIYSLQSVAFRNATSARQVPISTFSSNYPSRSTTITSTVRSRPELPRIVTIGKRENRFEKTSLPGISDSLRSGAALQRSTSLKSTTTQKTTTTTHVIKRRPVEKALPPPPPPEPNSTRATTRASSPARTIMTMRTTRTVLPREDPDHFTMPYDGTLKERTPTKALRAVQSIGILHSGPVEKMTRVMDFDQQRSQRPTTSRSNKAFHKRLFGASTFASADDAQPISSYSADFDTPKLRRRFSQVSSIASSRRKGSITEDPLMPVSVLKVHSNREDIAGGLTYLPRYTNSFAGFCKSAWRLQLADPKSFEIRHRNSTRQTPTLKCSKCTFEGPIYPQKILGDRYVWAKIPDSKVYSSFGISYTWQFLFKSHLALKKGTTKPPPEEKNPLIPPLPRVRAPDIDMADGLFGCIFCCAQGRGTPVFKGPEALSWHLRSHAEDEIDDEELTHRFRIIIGRDYYPNEKFDVHIPQLDTSSDNIGVSVSVSVNGDGHWEEPQVPRGNGDYNIPYQREANRTAGPTTLNTPMLDVAPPMPWETDLEKDLRLGGGVVRKVEEVQELPGDIVQPVELVGDSPVSPVDGK